MKQYLKLGREILSKNEKMKKQAREGMPDTFSSFGHQMRFDLSKGFPIITTKEISFKLIVVELLWFLRGNSNISFMVNNGCYIWNEDAYKYYLNLHSYWDYSKYLFSYYEWSELLKFSKEHANEYMKKNDKIYRKSYVMGDTGKQYPWLWRNWEDGNGNKVDQIANLIQGLRDNPTSRRHIISAWNPTTLEEMALPACHTLFQFNCREIPLEDRMKMNKGVEGSEEEMLNSPQYYLDLQLYQRSGDYFLGVPFNISSYSLLLSIIAEITNMIPGEFIHTLGDVHIYSNHIDQVEMQLKRKPHSLPKLNIYSEFWKIESIEDLFNSIRIEDFKLENYTSDEKIVGKLSTGLR